jgi:hypothetical protein
MEMYMKQPNGSPHLYLASSRARSASATKPNERLRSVIATLEGCHAVLVEEADRDSAQLLAITILQLRMNLHHIGDAELRELCNAMIPEQSENPDVPLKSNG